MSKSNLKVSPVDWYAIVEFSTLVYLGPHLDFDGAESAVQDMQLESCGKNVSIYEADTMESMMRSFCEAKERTCVHEISPKEYRKVEKGIFVYQIKDDSPYNAHWAVSAEVHVQRVSYMTDPDYDKAILIAKQMAARLTSLKIYQVTEK